MIKNFQNLENSIKYIKFKKNYVENNNWDAAFLIQMQDLNSAIYIKNIIENANIINNKNLKVELQTEKSRNRDNLLTIIIKGSEKYNPQFQNIIDKLINSKYSDQNFQSIAETVYPLLQKEYYGNDLDDQEFEAYMLYQENVQKDKYIDTEDFIKFLDICEKNQQIKISEIDSNYLLVTKGNPKPTFHNSEIQSSHLSSQSSSKDSA